MGKIKPAPIKKKIAIPKAELKPKVTVTIVPLNVKEDGREEGD